MKKILGPIVSALAAGSVAQAAVTYVDASATNTTTANSSSYVTGGNLYTDNLWSIRTVGSGGADVIGNTVFEAGPERVGGENVPMLTTTITGLTPDTMYEVFVYFVTFANDANQPWQIAAGLSPSSLNFYNRVSPEATFLTPGSTTLLEDSSANPVTVPTNRSYAQVSLGFATSNASGEIPVYIDAPAGTNDANNRTWYDGVGYAIPEPSSALLGLLGATALLRRRR